MTGSAASYAHTVETDVSAFGETLGHTPGGGLMQTSTVIHETDLSNGRGLEYSVLHLQSISENQNSVRSGTPARYRVRLFLARLLTICMLYLLDQM